MGGTVVSEQDTATLLPEQDTAALLPKQLEDRGNLVVSPNSVESPPLELEIDALACTVRPWGEAKPKREREADVSPSGDSDGSESDTGGMESKPSRGSRPSVGGRPSMGASAPAAPPEPAMVREPSQAKPNQAGSRRSMRGKYSEKEKVFSGNQHFSSRPMRNR